MEFPLRATSAMIFDDIYRLKVFHNTYSKIVTKSEFGKTIPPENLLKTYDKAFTKSANSFSFIMPQKTKGT